MGFYLSPLVAIQEEDWSAIIEGASTSIGAIVLENTRRGKEMVKTLITNSDVLINTFGKPTNNERNYLSMLTALRCLTRMNALYCVAVKPEDATYAGIKSDIKVNSEGEEVVEYDQLSDNPDVGTSYTLKSFSSDDIDDFAYEINPDGPFDIIATSRGSWGNDIRVAVVSAAAYDKIVRQNDADALKEYKFSNALKTTDLPINKESDFIILVQYLRDKSLNPAKDTSWDLVEAYKVGTVETGIDENGEDNFVDNVLLRSQYIRFALNDTYKNKPFTEDLKDWIRLGGGSDGDENADLDDLVSQAYNLFRSSEEIDVNIMISGGKSDMVQRKIVDICEERKDCMAICDVPKKLVLWNRGYETTDLVEWRKGIGKFANVDNFNISSDRCAVYANWCEVYDEYNKRYRWIPMSGFAAAVWSYTDESTEPWYAPAGVQRGKISGIRKLAYSPYLGERDLLYQAGLNPVVSFPSDGPVIWGQKTMYDSTSSFNRINVRRLFITLEKSIATYARPYVFQPNTAMTRAALSTVIGNYLADIYARQGIYEYQVICDTSNNTAARIDRGELWCDIKIKPVRSAEFIVLRFTNTSMGLSFSEITLDQAA